MPRDLGQNQTRDCDETGLQLVVEANSQATGPVGKNAFSVERQGHLSPGQLASHPNLGLHAITPPV